MKYRPSNTLAHYNAAYHVHQHDLSALPLPVLATATRDYKNQQTGSARPTSQSEALTFYTLNHCASFVRKRFTENEPLPGWAEEIMRSYTEACMAQGERMLHYILLVTTREMRHLNARGTPSPAFWTAVKAQFGVQAKTILEQITSHGDEDEAMAQYLNISSSITIGTYVKALSYGFHNAEGWKGPNNSHGGPKWGNVVDAAVAMLHGDTSLEQLVDTGYTLAHNGGPIYNKGHLYSAQKSVELLTILDVQRSGQLPDLIQATQAMQVKKTPEAVRAVELIQTHYPVDARGVQTLKGYMDWKLVDALRPAKDKEDSPGKYDVVIASQTQPITKKVVVVEPPAPVDTSNEVSTMTTLLGTKVKVVGEWAVYPHQKVKIVEREKE